jgi:DNA invertase Pin-like site-specific DNA recombinase
MTKQRLAWSYVRFSTKGQIHGDSLERQLSKAREYAKRHELILDESSYADLGISAFKGKNATEGALKAFLDAVDAGTVPSDCTLLIENFDRLSRNHVTDALDLFLSITKRGVTIVTLTDEQVYNRQTINENWTKLIITLAMFARAHEESATKSVRIKSGKAAKLEKGIKHAKCPFWLQATPDRLSFTIIEPKAELVREAYRRRLAGIGAHRLAIWLNAEHGFKYGGSQVARLLQNPAVIGTRLSQVHAAPLEGYYPEIVDKATFYDVQRQITSGLGTTRGKRTEDEANLFTGLARCAGCGSSMRFFRETKTVAQRYIRCLNAITHVGCNSTGYVNYDAFEKEAIGWLLLDQDEEFVSLLQPKPTLRAVSNAEVIALKEQQSRLIDLASSGLMNTTLVTEKLNALELQIKAQEAIVVQAQPNERMFAERAWELVERHDDAQLGDDPVLLVTVRRELKAAFQRALSVISVFPEERVEDVITCKFAVNFRGYDGWPERSYTRPALQNVKGVFNGR